MEVDVRHFTALFRGEQPHHIVKVDITLAGGYKRRAEICVSPTGRVVRLFLDGDEFRRGAEA